MIMGESFSGLFSSSAKEGVTLEGSDASTNSESPVFKKYRSVWAGGVEGEVGPRSPNK